MGYHISGLAMTRLRNRWECSEPWTTGRPNLFGGGEAENRQNTDASSVQDLGSGLDPAGQDGWGDADGPCVARQGLLVVLPQSPQCYPLALDI